MWYIISFIAALVVIVSLRVFKHNHLKGGTVNSNNHGNDMLSQINTTESVDDIGDGDSSNANIDNDMDDDDDISFELWEWP